VGKHLHRKKLYIERAGHSKKTRKKIIPEVITEAKKIGFIPHGGCLGHDHVLFYRKIPLYK
jgi:hypothetical protein